MYLLYAKLYGCIRITFALETWVKMNGRILKSFVKYVIINARKVLRGLELNIEI